jgi:hypothetical protein
MGTTDRNPNGRVEVLMQRVFLKIMKQLNYPPIFLIPPKQFEMIDGEEKRNENMLDAETFGIAATYYPVISVRDDIGGKTLANVIWHEIAHHLWPWRQHWWIEAFAERMADGGGKGMYCKKYGHSVADVPSKKKLLQMARRQAEKLKEKYKIAL